MTLIRHELFIPQLTTRFKVINVHWEPYAESEWYLQYGNAMQFLAYDQLFITKKKDEQLIGKIAIAHIRISVAESTKTTKKEKSFSCQQGWITATGVIEDTIKGYFEKDNGKYITYKLNSIFPIEITDIPREAKIGDWITVQGEAIIFFPYQSNTQSM